MAHQDQQLIVTPRTTRVKEEGPNGSKDRMPAPPTDKEEGEQTYSHITRRPSVLHKEACKRMYIYKEKHLGGSHWELDKWGNTIQCYR